MQKYLIVILLLLVIILGFAILNTTVVEVNLIFAKINVYLPILIAVSVLIGMGISWTMGLGDKFKKRSVINDLKRQVTTLDQKIIDQRKQIDSLSYTKEEASPVSTNHETV